MKKLFKNKKGVFFIAIILFILVFLIFIFAAPALFAVITIGAASTGTATSFVIKLFPWVIIGMLIFWLIEKTIGG